MRQSDRHLRGFTLVELLVVIAIIGILVALLLPAVQAAREASRRMSCSNNLKQIGLGLHNYHDTLKSFPPDAIWTSNKFGTTAQMGQQRNFTWIALLLPYIEQQGLYSQINFGIPGWGQTLPDGTTRLESVTLPSFMCPSDTPLQTLPWGFGTSCYAGSAGWDQYRRFFGDQRYSGVFPLLDPVSISDIIDGTSNVAMVGEVGSRGIGGGQGWKGGTGRGRIGTEAVYRSLLVAPAPWMSSHAWNNPPNGPGPLLTARGDAGTIWVQMSGTGPTWQSPYIFPPVYYCSNAPTTEWNIAGARHRAGPNIMFCDGSVRTISNTIAVGGQGGGGVGDSFGRFGNVWSAIHFIQGIDGKATANL